MGPVTRASVGALALLLASGAGALAQSPYHDDLACRQYADQALAPYQGQGATAAAGSALLGAGLGAALGAAAGGGRGAGIGAAAGALAGTGVGAANAQQYQGQLAQTWQQYYASCMASRQPAYAPQPAYGAPPPGYGQPYGYGAPQPAYQGYYR
jgi:hypothetical protein